MVPPVRKGEIWAWFGASESINQRNVPVKICNRCLLSPLPMATATRGPSCLKSGADLGFGASNP